MIVPLFTYIHTYIHTYVRARADADIALLPRRPSVIIYNNALVAQGDLTKTAIQVQVQYNIIASARARVSQSQRRIIAGVLL